MCKYITLLIIALPFFAFGRDSVATNHLYVSAMGQYNLNKWNVQNSSDQPNSMQAKNTVGNTFSLGYRHVTKYGLIIMVGVGLSNREHDIYIRKNIQDYDPASLSDEIVKRRIKFKIQSIDPEVMIGYRKSVNKHNAITIKTGVIQKRFLNANRGGQMVWQPYSVSNSNEYGEYMYWYNVDIGKPSMPNKGLGKIFTYYLLPQFSIGLEHTYNCRYIKYLSVDLNMILTEPLIRDYPQEFEFTSYKDVSNTSRSVYSYIDRFASIGLKVSMGLWK